jgi:nickel-dependent lactate racemase
MTAIRVELAYGRQGLELTVPRGTQVLAGTDPPPLPDPSAAVHAALEQPLGCPPLRELLHRRSPRTVAITVSDITRPVPNAELLPPLLEVLAAGGVERRQVTIVIGTGMHRPSTAAERLQFLGPELCGASGLRVVDHLADRPETLVRLEGEPPLQINREFAGADLRIVTGLIEPHFMAGYSGGRKGVFPALTDLRSIERFHAYDTLSDPRADNGVLEGNPCHEIALAAARRVGVDLLLNAAITRDRRLAGVYCGELERAHAAGCAEVARWTTAELDGPVDLVVTSGGGYPLDQTLYQTIKGMVSALPALGPESVLLQVSGCGEGLGSAAYSELLLRWKRDWRGFIAHLRAHRDETRLDQWELQMQCRVLERVGVERLWFVSDGIEPAIQRQLALTPLLGQGAARARAQRALDDLVAARGTGARIAVIPDGPYTMLEVAG